MSYYALKLKSPDSSDEAYEAKSLRSGTRMFDVGFFGGIEDAKEARTSMAKQAASEKLRRDPKQKDKLFVYDCWREWSDNPERYESKAAFARDMLAKCEHLVSAKKIEDWCRAWEIDTKNTNSAS